MRTEGPAYSRVVYGSSAENLGKPGGLPDHNHGDARVRERGGASDECHTRKNVNEDRYQWETKPPSAHSSEIRPEMARGTASPRVRRRKRGNATQFKRPDAKKRLQQPIQSQAVTTDERERQVDRLHSRLEALFREVEMEKRKVQDGQIQTLEKQWLEIESEKHKLVEERRALERQRSEMIRHIEESKSLALEAEVDSLNIVIQRQNEELDALRKSVQTQARDVEEKMQAALTEAQKWAAHAEELRALAQSQAEENAKLQTFIHAQAEEILSFRVASSAKQENAQPTHSGLEKKGDFANGPGLQTGHSGERDMEVEDKENGDQRLGAAGGELLREQKEKLAEEISNLCTQKEALEKAVQYLQAQAHNQSAQLLSGGRQGNSAQIEALEKAVQHPQTQTHKQSAQLLSGGQHVNLAQIETLAAKKRVLEADIQQLHACVQTETSRKTAILLEIDELEDRWRALTAEIFRTQYERNLASMGLLMPPMMPPPVPFNMLQPPAGGFPDPNPRPKKRRRRR